MAENKFYSPFKIGLLIVTLAYFIFTFHAMFTLSWIGEWEPMPGIFGFVIFVEDIGATIGLVFRFAASIIALVGVLYYFAKKGLPEQTARKILRVVLVFEAIYWLGLLPSGVMPLIYLRDFVHTPLIKLLTSLFAYDIPALVESTAIPIALFILAVKLSPKKPAKSAIKWGLITGTVYIFVFWVVNTGIWIITIWGTRGKGLGYLTSYPEIQLSFASTVFGLLALGIFMAYFTKKSTGAETLATLNLKTLGALIIVLGFWFFWNYLTWIFFGRPELWSEWFAWFLGHNMDLWILAIPLVGLPILYLEKNKIPT
jgi:hypothetical protein